MKTGIELIAAERERQVTAEGWTPEHDDEHQSAEMAQAARCYIGHACGTVFGLGVEKRKPMQWPWEESWWKPSERPLGDLVKAGALIAAEIDRLQRLENAPAEPRADGTSSPDNETR